MTPPRFQGRTRPYNRTANLVFGMAYLLLAFACVVAWATFNTRMSALSPEITVPWHFVAWQTLLMLVGGYSFITFMDAVSEDYWYRGRDAGWDSALTQSDMDITRFGGGM